MKEQLTINTAKRTCESADSWLGHKQKPVKCARTRGFTLVEMVIYVAFFAVLSVLAMNATILVMKSFYTLRISQSISQSATTALERMSREIRSATSIDLTNSSLSPTDPGRLTLNKKNASGAVYPIEFYVNAGKLNLRDNDIDKGSLLTKTVTITRLVFWVVTTPSGSKAIKIEMTLRDSRSSITKTVKYYDTIVLRGTVH